MHQRDKAKGAVKTKDWNLQGSTEPWCEEPTTKGSPQYMCSSLISLYHLSLLHNFDRFNNSDT